MCNLMENILGFFQQDSQFYLLPLGFTANHKHSSPSSVLLHNNSIVLFFCLLNHPPLSANGSLDHSSCMETLYCTALDRISVLSHKLFFLLPMQS